MSRSTCSLIRALLALAIVPLVHLAAAQEKSVCPSSNTPFRNKIEARRGSQAMLIEPQQLQKDLRRSGLRLLDTRPQPDYAKGHLPGAVRVDVKS
jgi:hypothetical protein